MRVVLLIIGALLVAVIGFIILNKASRLRANRVLMYTAIELNDVAAVRTLVEDGFNANQELDRYGNRPLHRAADRCLYEIVEYLVKKGADPKLKNRAGETPYKIARRRCGPDVPLSRLLEGLEK